MASIPRDQNHDSAGRWVRHLMMSRGGGLDHAFTEDRIFPSAELEGRNSWPGAQGHTWAADLAWVLGWPSELSNSAGLGDSKFAFFFFFCNVIYLFIRLWLCRVSAAAGVVFSSGNARDSRCGGFFGGARSLWQVGLRSCGSRTPSASSVVVVHGAHGIFPDQ